MKRQGTLFKKYLGTSMLIVFVSFLILAIVVLLFFAKYLRLETNEVLSDNATTISDATSGNMEESGGSFTIDNLNTIQGFLSSISFSSDISIIITDLNGNVITSAGDANKDSGRIDQIPQEMVDQAIYDKTYSVTTSFGSDKAEYFVSGVPLLHGCESGVNVPIGAVFTLANTKGDFDFMQTVFEVLVVAALVSFALAFGATWFASSRMTKPLKDMSEVVRSFGRGDFSRRIQVEDNDEIGQLSETFNNMANSLENFENVRRAFVSNLSHELRTPMTTISGFVDGMLDGTIPKDNQEHYLNIVSTEIKRLARLVKSMRNLSRVDTEGITINKSEFNVQEMIFALTELFEKVIQEKQLRIIGVNRFEETIINADSDMMFQVLYNLLENATKFTEEGGYIEFDIMQTDENTHIRIKNSGEGIPQEELPMIFDKFYKVDKSRSLDIKGMGLGLYISKTIVELHGGEIGVSSVPGEYCQFEITLER